MPDRGADLGADLYRLYQLAKVNLPNVAAEYATAASAVSRTDSGLSLAFVRPAQFGGTFGSAYRPWVEARDMIGKFLSDTSTNLTDTARALLLAVGTYAECDDAAVAELNRLKDQNGIG